MLWGGWGQQGILRTLLLIVECKIILCWDLGFCTQKALDLKAVFFYAEVNLTFNVRKIGVRAQLQI